MIESSRKLIRAACVAATLWYSPTAATAAGSTGVTAIRATDFLGSLGVNTKIQQGQDATRLAPVLQYLGVRAIREGNGANVASLIALHRQTGVLIDVDVGSGPNDGSLTSAISVARQLAAAGALLSIEGPNEPNNFGITYQGMKCCKNNASWLPVANFQRDLYAAAKSDPVLAHFPVFGVSEGGAEVDNVGLQFLTIPGGAGASMPEGTTFADFANVHNYVSGNRVGYIDNQAFKAAAATAQPGFDGLYYEYGVTWNRRFTGYATSALSTLPKVTTETGYFTDGTSIKDEIQGKILMNVFLDQYAAGWKYTFVYQAVDFGGENGWGLYKDYITPRKSAAYLHNLTTILADTPSSFAPGQLNYSIPNEPATVHDMLLQKSNGKFYLAVWGEQVSGRTLVTVNLGGTYCVVRAFDPTISGTVPSETPWTKVSQVSVTASDHPLILEITP